MAKDRNNCTTASLQYKLIKSQFIRQQPVWKNLKLLLYVQRKVNGRRRHRFQKVAFCLSTRKRNGGVVRLSHFGTRSQKVSFSVTQNAGAVWTEGQNANKLYRFDLKKFALKAHTTVTVCRLYGGGLILMSCKWAPFSPQRWELLNLQERFSQLCVEMCMLKCQCSTITKTR